MKRKFQVIEWNIDVKRGYWRATGKMNRDKQNEIFIQNAKLRQKIIGCLLAVISMVIWMALTAYDLKQIWWGTELAPLMAIGIYIMFTDKKVFKKLEKALREERKNGKE